MWEYVENQFDSRSRAAEFSIADPNPDTDSNTYSATARDR